MVILFLQGKRIKTISNLVNIAKIRISRAEQGLYQIIIKSAECIVYLSCIYRVSIVYLSYIYRVSIVFGCNKCAAKGFQGGGKDTAFAMMG